MHCPQESLGKFSAESIPFLVVRYGSSSDRILQLVLGMDPTCMLGAFSLVLALGHSLPLGAPILFFQVYCGIPGAG